MQCDDAITYLRYLPTPATTTATGRPGEFGLVGWLIGLGGLIRIRVGLPTVSTYIIHHA